jgi:MFS family permease
MNNYNRRSPSIGARALMFIATGLAMLGNYYVYDSIGPVADLLSHQLGTAYGLMTMLQNAGLTFANVIFGYLNDSGSASAAHVQGYAAMLWFFGLLSLSGFFFAVLLWRRDRSQQFRALSIRHLTAAIDN